VIEGSCHCGAVTLAVESAPVQVTDCNCSICRRYGVLWAYYSPKQVQVTGATQTYEWDDKSLKFHRCTVCGCVTHWSPNDPARDRMGVNARLLAPEVLGAATVRMLDGASW
jgi:hypothetical protein